MLLIFLLIILLLIFLLLTRGRVTGMVTVDHIVLNRVAHEFHDKGPVIHPRQMNVLTLFLLQLNASKTCKNRCEVSHIGENLVRVLVTLLNQFTHQVREIHLYPIEHAIEEKAVYDSYFIPIATFGINNHGHHMV